jgi:hypothetical protein
VGAGQPLVRQLGESEASRRQLLQSVLDQQRASGESDLVLLSLLRSYCTLLADFCQALTTKAAKAPAQLEVHL